MARLDVSNASPEQQKEILKYAADFYKSEIENFWKRSLFFWGFIGAAFIAYAAVYNKQDAAPILLVIACFGLVCSLAWTLLNRGSKYWYEAWEQKVKSIEKCALGVPLFTNMEPLLCKGWWGAANFTVSKLTVALSDFTVAVWALLGWKVLPMPALFHSDWCVLIPLILTGLYIVLLFTMGRSEPREKISPP
jgi:hypothetical protein